LHKIHLPEWAVERGRHLNHFSRIEPPHTALIAVDLQNAFMLPGEVFGNPHACDIVPNVNRVADTLRRCDGKVIWTRQTISEVAPRAYPQWQFDERLDFVRQAKRALTEGAPGHALHPGVRVEAADRVLNKYRYSAFARHSSDLDGILQEQGIDTLIIAGTLTNCCCESTARDANMLGYKVLFLSDATAAVTDEEHNAALLNLRIMFADVRTTEEVLHLLESASAA
jgi:nicotinamidase-related amidase